jgi:hypothetical protein
MNPPVDLGWQRGGVAMTHAQDRRPPLLRTPRPVGASFQDAQAALYPAWVRALTMAAFALAFLGWINESWLFLWDSPIWLNRYT